MHLCQVGDTSSWYASGADNCCSLRLCQPASSALVVTASENNSTCNSREQVAAVMPANVQLPRLEDNRGSLLAMLLRNALKDGSPKVCDPVSFRASFRQACNAESSCYMLLLHANMAKHVTQGPER